MGNYIYMYHVKFQFSYFHIENSGHVAPCMPRTDAVVQVLTSMVIVCSHQEGGNYCVLKVLTWVTQRFAIQPSEKYVMQCKTEHDYCVIR